MKRWNKMAAGAILMAVLALSGCGSRNGGQDSDGQGDNGNPAAVEYGSENPTADYLFEYYGAVDGAGNVCLTYKEADQLWLVNGDELVDTIPLGGRKVTALASGTDGSIYGADSTGSLFTVNAEEGSLEEVLSVSGSQGDICLAAAAGGKLLCGDKLGLYFCDPAAGTAELLTSWKDVGISGQHVCTLSILSDDRLLILDDDGVLFCLTKVDASQLPDRRQKVVLGVLTANDSLKNLVTEFNQRNYYYEVEIKEYGWENGSQLIDSAVVAGNGPDMVDVSAIYVDKYVRKGLLEDISHYLEDGHGLEREDLVDSVLRCYTIDGVLICIPGSFSIDTLMGRASLLGEETGWTIEEYLDFVQKNRGSEVAEGQWFSRTAGDSRTIIPLLVMKGDINAFVDWETGQAKFDGEDFSNLMSVAAGYESNARYNVETNSWRPGVLQRMREGNVLLHDFQIYSVDDYLNRQAALGGDTVYIGYPTLDGRSCNGVYSSKAYAILADSAAKDGAWAFQEFLLTSKKNSGDGGDWETWSNDFSVMRRALDYSLEQSMCKAYATNDYGDFLRDEEGNPIEIPISRQGEWDVYAATLEEVEQLRSLIDSLSFTLTWQGNEIFDIVYGELDICMSGDRSVEETINIIQNRVQLYLDENQ